MSPKEAKTIDFEKMFKISLTALKMNRSHPNIPRNKKWLIQFFIMHGIFTVIFVIILYNIYLDITHENYFDACRDCIAGALHSVVSFQYLILIAKQKNIVRIMDMIKADYAKDMPEEEREIVFEYARKGKGACFQWLVLSAYTSISFPATHLFLEVYTYAIDGWKLLPMYALTYPSPIEEIKHHPLVYALIYLILAYYFLYVGIMHTAFPPLGQIFMLHACGQLDIVKRKILALYKDDCTDTVEKLKDIVEHLQYIYGFIDSTQEVFALIYEFSLKATAITLPIIMYGVLGSFNRGEYSTELIAFIFGGVIYSSFPCYYSEMLMEKGMEVRLAIYSCGWETRYDHGVRKTLLVMLLRTLRATVIRTVFRTVCMEALTDVFHQAYAIFSLINAVWD